MRLYHIRYFVQISTFYPIIHGKKISAFLFIRSFIEPICKFFQVLVNQTHNKDQRNAMQYDSWIVHIAIIGLLIFSVQRAHTHTHNKNPPIQQF